MQIKTWVTMAAVACATAMVGVGAALAADEAPAMGWKSEVVGGLGLTAGNSKTMTINAGAATQERSETGEFRANVDYKYGESTIEDDKGKEIDDTTTDNVQGGAQYNYLLSLRNYALVQLTAVHDAIADIQYRVIGGPGLGHYLLKRANRQLSVETGVAFLGEEVNHETDNAILFRAAERFEQSFEVGSKIWESAEYLPQSDDFGVYLITAEVGAEALMSKSMSLRVVVQDRYDSEPAEDRDENDLTVTAGLVYKL
ncbi:MAG: DUF481 domain-containing protein [Lentisphaerae bacterium]|nr:DUF481 domain-containing protein [Lentisphaerota bacterium]